MCVEIEEINDIKHYRLINSREKLRLQGGDPVFKQAFFLYASRIKPTKWGIKRIMSFREYLVKPEFFYNFVPKYQRFLENRLCLSLYNTYQFPYMLSKNH